MKKRTLKSPTRLKLRESIPVRNRLKRKFMDAEEFQSLCRGERIRTRKGKIYQVMDPPHGHGTVWVAEEVGGKALTGWPIPLSRAEIETLLPQLEEDKAPLWKSSPEPRSRIRLPKVRARLLVTLLDVLEYRCKSAADPGTKGVLMEAWDRWGFADPEQIKQFMRQITRRLKELMDYDQ